MEVGTQCLPNRFQCKKAKVSFALPFRVVWFLLVRFFIAGLLLHLECVFHWELNASRLGDRPSHSISASSMRRPVSVKPCFSKGCWFLPSLRGRPTGGRSHLQTS